MSKVCQITGKKRTIGHNLSHSKRQTKRSVYPNLQLKRLLNPATGRMMKVKLSASALKTLVKWQKQGKVYDLRQLIKDIKDY